MKKLISTDDLKIGMYLVGINEQWIKTPFLKHNFLIDSIEQIEKIKAANIKQVYIDISKGIDVVPLSEGDALADKPGDKTKPADSDGKRNLHATGVVEDIIKIDQQQDIYQQQEAFDDEVFNAKKIRVALVKTVSDVTDAVKEEKPIDIEPVIKATDDMAGSILRSEQAMITLNYIS